jgi:uncharacterized membrane protein YedE/YeeE
MILSNFLSPLAGGLLIGLAAGGFRLATGRIAGIAGIIRLGLRGPERGWRLLFLTGLIVAGLAARWLAEPSIVAAGLSDTPTLRLVVAGLLVGLGTGMANGCTSGHGICGLASFSPRSLVSVLTFMAMAALTVLAMRLGGW